MMPSSRRSGGRGPGRPRRGQLELYGLPLATAAFGIAGTVLGLLSLPAGAAVAVSGAIVVASLDVVGRVRAADEAHAATTRALDRLAEAAQAFRHEIESGMPLGGTTVPDGTLTERLVAMAQQLREHRFTFLQGRRWSDWSWLGTALTKGRQEIIAAAGLTGGRLPIEAEIRVRAFSALLQAAARHAFEIASYYAGYDVTEEPKLPRYTPSDHDVDATQTAAYTSFASEFSDILVELDRMAGLP